MSMSTLTPEGQKLIEKMVGDVVDTGFAAGWNAAIEACKKAQPCTAEKPSESSYTKGHFDGVMDYGRAIRDLRRS